MKANGYLYLTACLLLTRLYAAPSVIRQGRPVYL
jgi:hypothetical protein